MMNCKLLRRHIDKQELQQFPVEAFTGRIVTILTEGEARRAVDFLLTQPLVGIDTETRPSFVSGRQHRVALLQVATADLCFLFRLNHMGLPPSLVRLFEDERVAKVGLSLHDDFRALYRRAPFEPHNVIELQHLVREFGIEDISLQKMYAILFEKQISKSQRLTNWEADVLTDRQRTYAATDAWACVMMYRYLLELKATGNYELEPLPSPQEPQNNETV